MKLSLRNLLVESDTSLVGYHGTHTIMNKPDFFKEMMGTNFGPGFYFAEIPEDTKNYGYYIYRANLLLNNPIYIGGNNDELVLKLQKALKIRDEYLSFNQDKLLALFELSREITSPTNIMKWLIKQGYDGIIVPANLAKAKGKYLAVFSPNQILSWELINS